MPRVNGLELVRIIREYEKLKSLIIFVLATSDLKEDKVSAYKLNVAGYIVSKQRMIILLALLRLLSDTVE
jgi:DNA-binding response OmpR family regulator